MVKYYEQEIEKFRTKMIASYNGRLSLVDQLLSVSGKTSQWSSYLKTIRKNYREASEEFQKMPKYEIPEEQFSSEAVDAISLDSEFIAGKADACYDILGGLIGNIAVDQAAELSITLKELAYAFREEISAHHTIAKSLMSIQKMEMKIPTS